MIDRLLERAIDEGTIGQIVEIAGGLSGRGLRFAERYASRGLVYVEGDLAPMARRKRRILEGLGGPRQGHHVVAIDALSDDGPLSLAAATESMLDPERGTAIVSEGLLNYFDREAVLDMWSRFSCFLARFPAGQYLSDIHLGDALHARAVPRLFLAGLGAFAAGRIHLHFATAGELTASCAASGFARSRIHHPASLAGELGFAASRGPDHVRVLECWSSGEAGAR
jgi:O-methyltransferase involved in polyketide biosynthesis